jgi:hypothetical protein
MSSAVWSIQAALVARLKATAGVTSLVSSRIYDGRAPEGAPKPYIVVGESVEEPQNAFAQVGVADTLTCHVFSKSPENNRREVVEIVAAMDAALASPLTLEDWGTASCRPEFLTVVIEEDGTRHAPRRYRILARAA